MDQAESKKLFTISEIAAYLSLKQKTLYAKVEAGEIPHYKIGRLIRFRKDEIDSWLENLQFKSVLIRKRETRRLRRTRRAPDIEKLIKKTIDECKLEEYTFQHGKSDQIKGLGKEV
jgi:excisionase family DNA binding protein